MDDQRWPSAVGAFLITDVNESENPAALKCISAPLTHVCSLMDIRRLSVNRRDIHAVLKENCSPKPKFLASRAYLSNSDSAFTCNNNSTTLAKVRQQRKGVSLVIEKLVKDGQQRQAELPRFLIRKVSQGEFFKIPKKVRNKENIF